MIHCSEFDIIQTVVRKLAMDSAKPTLASDRTLSNGGLSN